MENAKVKTMAWICATLMLGARSSSRTGWANGDGAADAPDHFY